LTCAQVLKSGCAKVAPPADAPPARPLNYVVPASEPWPPTKTCEELSLTGLCEVVGKVALDRTVRRA
jgi:hypothetical protein